MKTEHLENLDIRDGRLILRRALKQIAIGWCGLE
jgi:hypothetical protein